MSATPPTRRDLELALTGTTNALAKAEARRAGAEVERDAAIRHAVDCGMTTAAVAELATLSRQRVEQIAAPAPVEVAEREPMHPTRRPRKAPAA